MIHFEDNGGVEWSFDERDLLGERGGMGAVFAGRAADGTAVAVKRVTLPHPSESGKRQRDREVEIVERLVRGMRSGNDTSHLVVPLGYRFLDDDLLIVMPRADESLKAALQRTSFDVAAGVDIVRQVAQGLVQLAALTISHRDLKPGNVLRFGSQWKIADFGLSRDLSEATGTYTLAGGGTVPYFAPELWLNQPANAKSDLYALGVLAFEVFTGARPFNGPDHHDFRRQHLHEAPPDLVGVPPKVARLVLRLLHKSPAERPQDARATCDVLDTYALRLRPEQEELVGAALALEQHHMAHRTAESVAGAEAEQRADLRRQALADLDEILADAYDDLHEALPDVEVDAAARRIALGGLVIGFDTSEPLQLSTRDTVGSAVLVGVVRQLSHDGQRSGGAVHAHLKYAARDATRLSWSFTWPTSTDADHRPLDATAVLDILRAAMRAHAEPERGRTS